MSRLFKLFLLLAFIPQVALADCVTIGATSVTIPFVLRKTADNTETTGKVAADMTTSYQISQAARVGYSPSDLAATTTAWTSGGVKEIDSTNQPGLYRLDVPNAAWASGSFVVISVKVASSYVYHEKFELKTSCASDATSPTGTVVSSTATTLVLPSTASATDNIYKGMFVLAKLGTSLQVRRITGYVGSSKTATINRPWTTNPDNTYSYYLIANDDVLIGATRN